MKSYNTTPVSTSSKGRVEKNEIQNICFREYCFEVELAIAEEERAYGLMFKEHLGQNKGMLFIFPREEKHGFWMKNTLIPLDIIWLNKNSEVVFINKKTQPCADGRQCEVVNPNKKALYVLEINAGLADEIGLKIGNKAFFK